MKWSWLVAAALVFGTAACNSKQNTVLVQSASGESAYASRFPEELQRARNDFLTRESEARQKLQAFANYPSELDKPDWKQVKAVYQAADAAGHSSAYVQQARENQSVTRFFDEEKEEISKKVAGAANYAAKQKSCKVEVYGPASHALQKSVEKQLEERLRAHNEAHSLIADNAEALGKPNREKLEKQADDIAATSYAVRVQNPESIDELKRRVDESKDVGSTLDRVIEEAKAVEADSARADADKKAATARREHAEKAKSELETEVSAAQKLLEEMENRVKALQEEYDKAFKDLEGAVDGKASEGSA